MDLKEPIFEKISEVPYDELSDEIIEEWIEVSKKYHDQKGAVVGMHGTHDCDDVDNGCCELCGEGHVIITGIKERESGNITSMVGCTKSGCSGKFL